MGPVLASWLRTFEDAGHRVLGLFWQNGAEAGNKLWRPKVDEQLSQTTAGETNVWNQKRTHVQRRDVELKAERAFVARVDWTILVIFSVPTCPHCSPSVWRDS